MYIDIDSFSTAKKLEFSPTRGIIRKIFASIKQLFETSDEEIARFQEYQELKEMWLKEIEDSAPKHMKARIRAGGWI